MPEDRVVTANAEPASNSC